jgi:MscS family membrane protein
MFSEHPRVEPSSHRARFVRFGDFSFDLEVFAYVFAPAWPDFLETQEGLLFRVMDIIEASGASFAFPSQTMYVARDSRPEAKRRDADLEQKK